MSFSVAIRHRLGDFELDAAFEGHGRLVALFGPSGSGKTSIVRAIAGLIRPQEGRIVANDRVLSDAKHGIFLKPHQRRIGYVFQDARLFPHLTCRQNLLFGRWFTPAPERYVDVEQVIDLLGIGHLLARQPGTLSGGERQRVAIGRALAASPRLLLMDEPLASLDEKRKAEILPYIERLRDEMSIPIVYVSHSVAEVARLADQIVLLEDGKVAASGDAAEVMARTELLAREDQAEAGALLELTVASHDADYGMTVLASPAGEVRVPRFDAATGTPVRLRIRARDVMLALKRPDAISGLNILEGRLRSMTEAGGGQVDVTMDCHGQLLVARITRLSADRLALKTDMGLFAIVKSVSFEGGHRASAAPRSS
jgi:molybdate transport system ATP-binding protein